MKMKEYFPRGNLIDIEVSAKGDGLVFSTERLKNFPLADDGLKAILHAVNNYDSEVSEHNALKKLFINYINSVMEGEGVPADYFMNSVGSSVKFTEQEIELVKSLVEPL